LKILRRRAELVVGLTLLLVAIVLACAAAFIAQKHYWATDKLAELEPRYARLLGLVGAKDTLQRSAAEAERLLASWVFPGEQSVSQVGASAQQHARQLAEAAGLSVSSSQILQARNQGAFELIPVSMSVEGGLPALRAFLESLYTQSPLLLLDTLSVQAGARVSGAQPRLAIQITVSALRLRS
jgi:general secretion pathway protein M